MKSNELTSILQAYDYKRKVYPVENGTILHYNINTL